MTRKEKILAFFKDKSYTPLLFKELMSVLCVPKEDENEFSHILKELENEGYITKYDIVEEGNFNTIRITLKYGADKNEKVISGIKKISKPGLRVYAGKDELPRVLGGLGIAILSTNQGIITDKEARKLQVGGEVLAFVW